MNLEDYQVSEKTLLRNRVAELLIQRDAVRQNIQSCISLLEREATTIERAVVQQIPSIDPKLNNTVKAYHLLKETLQKIESK